MTAMRVDHRHRLLLVVRDVDERRADVAMDLRELDLEPLAELEVERAERLVEQQHGRAVDERARDRDPLLLAAGELARQPVAELLEPDEPRAPPRRARATPTSGRVPSSGRSRRCRARSCAGRARSDWKTVLTLRRCGGSRSTRSVADVDLAAASALTKPPIRFSVVVLPQPDGPSRQKNSPSAISRSVGCSASWLAVALRDAGQADRRCRRRAHARAPAGPARARARPGRARRCGSACSSLDRGHEHRGGPAPDLGASRRRPR